MKFSDNVDTLVFQVPPHMTMPIWKSTRRSTRYSRKAFDQNMSAGYVADPVSHYKSLSGRRSSSTGTQDVARGAIARALSLAALLGLPARTYCLYNNPARGSRGLIADTGCGKDMVSDSTFSKEFLAKNSWKRETPLRIQTANGLITLDTEVDYRIDELQQTTSAIVGGNTPDLLSVGYRCQELGYGFHWKPYSIPYFVLPDGKTQVTCAVEQYVPYIYDSGDIACHPGSKVKSMAVSKCEEFLPI